MGSLCTEATEAAIPPHFSWGQSFGLGVFTSWHESFFMAKLLCAMAWRGDIPPCPGVTHPLHPWVLQNLGGTESLLCILNQKLGDEVFGLTGDVSPVFVRKLIFAFLDALK